jgi:2-polyprenyl-3-methyl-5-hydroxy-6-metoxy-1,4-benzoquinol methylase
MESPAQTITADEVVARVNADVARRREASVPTGHPLASRGMAFAAGTAGAQRLRWQSEFSPRTDRSPNISDLTAVHDSAFIDAAYRTILERPVDPGGRRHNTNLLQQGARKADILGRIRYSKEGRKKGVAINGLAPRFALLCLLRIPIFGQAIDWLIALVSISKRARLTRQFEAFVLSRVELLANEAPRATQQAIEESVGTFSERLQTGIADFSAQLASERERSDLKLTTFEQNLVSSTAAWEERAHRVVASQQAEVELAKAGRVADARSREALDEQIRIVSGLVDGLQLQIENEAAAWHAESGSLSTRLDGAERLAEHVQALSTQLGSEQVERQHGALKLASEIARVDALQAQLGGLSEMLQTGIAERSALATRIGSEQAERSALATRIGNEQAERERGALDLANEISRADALQAQLVGLSEMLQTGIAERGELAVRLGSEHAERERGALDLANELARVDALQAQVGDLAELVHADVADGTTLQQRFDESEQALHRIRLDSIDQARRLDLLLQEARRCMPEPLDQPALEIFADEGQHGLDALYAELGDTFRGSRRDIKSRVTAFLPYVRDAEAGSLDAPVLDLGCGRGEWLELLDEQGLRAQGVDMNRLLVGDCHARDLDVADGDAIEYLCKQPDASFGAVTGFHILEHLPLEQLIRVLDETVRVLRPGGVSIFETPNPANIQVGSHLFYMDPTHRNPLPSRVLSFLAEARGLTRVEVLDLHPCAKSAQVKKTDALANRFNKFFYGPQDYAVIGYKA